MLSVPACIARYCQGDIFSSSTNENASFCRVYVPFPRSVPLVRTARLAHLLSYENIVLFSTPIYKYNYIYIYIYIYILGCYYDQNVLFLYSPYYITRVYTYSMIYYYILRPMVSSNLLSLSLSLSFSLFLSYIVTNPILIEAW